MELWSTAVKGWIKPIWDFYTLHKEILCEKFYQTVRKPNNWLERLYKSIWSKAAKSFLETYCEKHARFVTDGFFPQIDVDHLILHDLSNKLPSKLILHRQFSNPKYIYLELLPFLISPGLILCAAFFTLQQVFSICHID